MSEAASTQCHISPLTTHNTLWQKTKKNPSPRTIHKTLWQKDKEKSPAGYYSNRGFSFSILT